MNANSRENAETPTAGIPRFSFDETAAETWARQAMTRAAGNGPGPWFPPGIDSGWRLSGDNAADLSALTAAATAAGIITCTADAELSVETRPSDAGYKHAVWWVEITLSPHHPGSLTLQGDPSTLYAEAGAGSGTGSETAASALAGICGEANAVLGRFAEQAAILTGHALPQGASTVSTTVLHVYGRLSPADFRRIGQISGLELGGGPKPWAEHFAFGPMTPPAAAKVTGFLESARVNYDVETTSMRRHQPAPARNRTASRPPGRLPARGAPHQP